MASCLGIISASGTCSCSPGPETTVSDRRKKSWGDMEEKEKSMVIRPAYPHRKTCIVVPTLSLPTHLFPNPPGKWRNLFSGDPPVGPLMLSMSTHSWKNTIQSFMFYSPTPSHFKQQMFQFLLWLLCQTITLSRSPYPLFRPYGL